MTYKYNIGDLVRIKALWLWSDNRYVKSTDKYHQIIGTIQPIQRVIPSESPQPGRTIYEVKLPKDLPWGGFSNTWWIDESDLEIVFKT